MKKRRNAPERRYIDKSPVPTSSGTTKEVNAFRKEKKKIVGGNGGNNDLENDRRVVAKRKALCYT